MVRWGRVIALLWSEKFKSYTQKTILHVKFVSSEDQFTAGTRIPRAWGDLILTNTPPTQLWCIGETLNNYPRFLNRTHQQFVTFQLSASACVHAHGVLGLFGGVFLISSKMHKQEETSTRGFNPLLCTEWLVRMILQSRWTSSNPHCHPYYCPDSLTFSSGSFIVHFLLN